MIVVALLASGCAGLDYIALLGVGGPRWDRTTVVGGARIDVDIGHRNLALSDAVVMRWVERSALMVSEYCGGFPVDALRVQVVSGVPGGVLFGQHWRGRRVAVLAGGSTTPDELATDWVMVHELSHTAFPDLPRRHLWMREGLSTYLETLLRARSGAISEDDAWRRWALALPHGLPRPGDRGLDFSPGIRRTYLGGALFWLLVDVEVRARTRNHRSLRDIVRAVLREGGTSRRRWRLSRVLRVAGDATGTPVVAELYREMGLRPGARDPDDLFARLGVTVSDEGDVSYDEDAPLSHVRRAMHWRAGVALPPIRP